MNAKTEELFSQITDRIIKVIEDGQAGTWSKPWTQVFAAQGIPHNVTTKKPYKGMNVLILWAEGAFANFETAEWATYKQWQSIGAQVRKGEAGTKLVKWGFTYKCSSCDAKGMKPCSRHPEADQNRFGWATTFTVFNAGQVDGYDPETVELPGGFDPMDEVEAFVNAIGADIREVAGDRAYFSPSEDYIVVPKREQFSSRQGFYGTLLHELTHWSGHESRLGRAQKNLFGDHRYAAEELVAELGATFLSARFGVEVEPHQEHAAYLASWLRAMKDDPMSLYRAAKLANEAVEFLLTEADAPAIYDEEEAA